MPDTATQPNIADVLPEPADGTHLVRVEYDRSRTVIWRDDAGGTSRYATERWFDSADSDPLEWREILRYTIAVHSVSEEPVACMPEAKP